MVRSSDDLMIKLKKRIDKMSAGDKLPREVDLCVEFGVSRMTVNKVIKKLAEDGVVYRRKKAGTFVSGCKQRQSPLYFLVPCPGYMELSHYLARFYSLLMSSLQSVTLGKVIPIIPVVVSPTNDENDIDLRNMEVIEPGGTVICSSIWYHETFSWLQERKCNVVYINNQIAEDVFNFTDKWHYLTLDYRQAAFETIRRFREHGCVAPAFVPMLYRNKRTKMPHPLVDGWMRGMKKFYPELSPEKQQILYYPEDDSVADLSNNIYKFLKTHECDSLFLTNSSMLEAGWKALTRRRLNSPEDVFIVTNRVEDLELGQALTFFDFPAEEIASAVLKICAQSELQNMSIQASFSTVDAYSDAPDFFMTKSLLQDSSRRLSLEKAHA